MRLLALLPFVAAAVMIAPAHARDKQPETPPKPQNVTAVALSDGSRAIALSCDFGGATFGRGVAERITLFRDGKRIYSANGTLYGDGGSSRGCGVRDEHPPGGPVSYQVAIVAQAAPWYPKNPPVVLSDPITVETVGPPPGSCTVTASFGLKGKVRSALTKLGRARISVIGGECAGKVANVSFAWSRGGQTIALGTVPVTLGDYGESIPAVLKVDRKRFRNTRGGTLSASIVADGQTTTRTVSFGS